MNTLTSYLDDLAAALAALPAPPLARIAEALWQTYAQDATIFVCGNGGSAATASHFACDLSKWTVRPRMRRVRAIALTDNVPLLTAWANDTDYDHVFVEQLRSLFRPGDLLFTISGSGNSPNVLQAAAWTKEQGAVVVGLTGFDGGRLARLVTHSLNVHNNLMPQIEDVHSAICHALAVQMAVMIDQSR